MCHALQYSPQRTLACRFANANTGASQVHAIPAAISVQFYDRFRSEGCVGYKLSAPRGPCLPGALQVSTPIMGLSPFTM